MTIITTAATSTMKSKLVAAASASIIAKVLALVAVAGTAAAIAVTTGAVKSKDMPAILIIKEPVKAAAPIVAPIVVIPSGPRFEIGVNVAPSTYYNSERIFANLAQASGGWKDPSAGWGYLAESKQNSYGNPLVGGVLALNVPQPVWAGKDVAVTCTWLGAGSVRIDGDTRAGGANNSVSFTWRGKSGAGRPNILVYVTNANATDPFRALDCREPGLVANGQFDQRYVDDMKAFGVLRFLDWSNTNGNPATVTWANRATPEKAGVDGLGLEQMIDLANAADSDAWFTVAYNADETYVRNMAKLVHDRLKPGHRAYFELSNEIWNFAFPVATQALNEGIAEKLSTDKYSNGLMRYAEKSIWMHKILTEAFADNPSRLVRVVSTQNDNSWTARTILAFRDTANWVDALATAPYFGHSFYSGANAGVTDVDKLFVSLEAMRVNALVKANENKAAAAKYGKRFIAYEGGQHIIASAANAATDATMQRSPMMYDMYKRFLTDWKAQIGDTMTLYSATGGIGQSGSWGMREYAGQPMAETPKLRAAMEFTRK
ncbi:hypothetical protein ACT009_00590 [Sphingomonas sp. Tas61C01]|uniref:hypothetical protein n=1 Tax=Sphingomonas sp. Tas61C01 TaxID=3458297 RepID=UPI00403E5151